MEKPTNDTTNDDYKNALIDLLKASNAVIAEYEAIEDRDENTDIPDDSPNLQHFNALMDHIIESYGQPAVSQPTIFLRVIPFSPLKTLMAIAALFIFVIAGIFLLTRTNGNQAEILSPPVKIALALEPSEQVAYVLNVEGNPTTYQQGGSNSHLPLMPATQLSSKDVVVGENVVLEILCADGSVQRVRVSNSSVACANIDTQELSITTIKTESDTVFKGASPDDPSVVYVISPRSTYLLTPKTSITFNPLFFDVAQFTINVYKGDELVWASDRLQPDDVIDGDIANVDLPITLEAQASYSIEICVLFTDLNTRCTADSDWSTPFDLSFSYVPNATLDTLFSSDLEADTPQNLLTKAIILSQPISGTNREEPVGYYMESLALLEQLLQEFPDSSQATSPATLNLQAEIYRQIHLPRTASQIFERSLAISEPNTKESAVAAFGLALTTTDNSRVVELHETSLDYYSYLSPDDYQAQFESNCSQIGDLCLQLKQCSEQIDICEAWIEEN